MDKDKFKILKQNAEHILSVVNQIYRDNEGAIKDSQEVSLRLGNVEQRLTHLEEMIAKMPAKVGDKVDIAMQPAQDLKDAIDQKANLKIEIKRRWYEFWK